jgi:hypothetical protein
MNYTGEKVLQVGKIKEHLQLLAAGGMELSWLCATAAFFMAMVESPPFPFPQAMAAFCLAAVLTLMTRGLGWRVIHTLVLHLAGLTATTLHTLYVFFGPRAAPFLEKAWLLEIFGEPKEPLEGLILALVIIFAAAFYLAGLALARRSTVYISVTRRLDLGIGIFLLLLLVSAGIGLPDSTAGLLLFPFFFFSMLAVALARNRGDGKKEYLPGQRWVGLVLTFAVTVLLFTAGAALLLPYLTMAAETGLALLKWVFAPFPTLLLPLLKFILGAGSGRRVSETGDLPGDSGALIPDSSPGSSLTELVGKIFGLGLLGLAALLLLAAAAGCCRMGCLVPVPLAPQPEPGEQRRARFLGAGFFMAGGSAAAVESTAFFHPQDNPSTRAGAE